NPCTDFTMPQLTPKHFSFNSHLGACPACHGLGTELVCDADLIVPDHAKSLNEGAVQPWAKAVKRMRGYYRSLLASLAENYGVSMDTSYQDLPDIFKDALLHGTGDREIDFAFESGSRKTNLKKPFEGVI